MHHWSTLRRLSILPGLAVVVLLLGGLQPSAAQAAVKGCRSDPIVVLSDGAILDVQAAIGTDVANVREIHYVIHGPPGVRLVAVITTPTLGFEGKETFTYVDDAAPREYVTETLVRTIDDRVVVTAHTTFASTLLGGGPLLKLWYAPVSGYSDQVLRVALKR